MFAIIAALTTLATFGTADIVNSEFASSPARSSDNDLLRFITRPDLTPPKFEVSLHEKEDTAPGYIFVAPYDCLDCGRKPVTTYVTQQMGPHIYTQDGELVWSGIDLFPDRKVFDFRPVVIDGLYHLALIAPQDADWHVFPDGGAMVLNASYQPVHMISSEQLGYKIDLHEFNILNDGRTALLASNEGRETTAAEIETLGWKGKIAENYFAEIDIPTQQKRFEWQASDHVDIMESQNPLPVKGVGRQDWDWFHINSIDKDRQGNYLISARFTDTIYLISDTGSIIWRLGGIKSSFQQDFNFSRQHHARIRRQNQKEMVISFFDNAIDDLGEMKPTSDSSALFVVSLDLETMTATQKLRFPRPDFGHTEAKGNVQSLPNDNILAGWGENAYMTEFRPGGKIVYEASFASQRFANYRAYKMPFVGQPLSKPTAKAFAIADSRGNLGTNIYVSWNGATEVALWRYYSYTASKSGDRGLVEIGVAYKKGFETAYLAQGYHPIIFVEAVSSHGTSLANSTLVVTELPPGFHDSNKPLVSQRKREEENRILMRTAVAFVAGIAFTLFWNRRQTFVRLPTSLRWPSKAD